jgi:hypothetical protein
MRNEHAAVRHILSAPAIAGRTARYVGADDIDVAGLLAETPTMAGGEALLVRIAIELWSAEKSAGLWELPRRLDRRNFERVLEALEIARGETGAAAPAIAA